MEQITLKATPRDLLGKKVKILRGKGQIPAVCYGRNFKAIPLILDSKNFGKITQEAGEATIIDLQIPQKERLKVLIRHIQKHPVTDEIVHVDLYKVDMGKEIQTEIPLDFEGTAPAVEELEGNLITNKDSVRVECLPDKLVSEIKVQVSALKTFEDLIRVKDLYIPEGIKVLDDTEEIVAQVTPPRSEEELKVLEKEVAAEAEKTKIEGIEAEAEAEKAKKEAETAPEEEIVATETPPQGQKVTKDEKKE